MSDRLEIRRKDPPDLASGMPSPGAYAPLGAEPSSAYVGCPECGRFLTLKDHEIDEGGTVEPSVVCPYDDCDFHARVKLEDWEEGAA